MDRTRINKINVERLTSWKNKLNEQHATPVLLLGVGHDAKQGELTVLVTEDTTDETVLLLLQGAMAMLLNKV